MVDEMIYVPTVKALRQVALAKGVSLNELTWLM